MNWEQFTQELFRLAEPYLKARNDFLHTRVAHQYAVYLLEKEAGEKKIVEPAVILHDVGWSQLQPEDIKIAFGVGAKGEKAKKLNRIHEVEGARIAREILKKLGHDRLSIDKIARIIERHDSGKNPQTIEEKLVKDADRLWRFSKIGYYHEMQRQNTTHEVRYHFLTLHTGNWFFTKTAKELADTELQERVKEHSAK
ncbi:MAG: HD domain-containing protein [Deltaproteobacteria bacterium]|jgi:HD superfamily phosphodiesterase|nr:HD domain-containing protein [Deltaproteobacteria bacterium]